MNFQRLTHSGEPLFETAFTLYETGFPLHEQRPRPAQEAVLVEKEYHFEAILDEDSFVGLVFYWETSNFIYIEHFAISPALRGRNYGSRALNLLREKEKTLILEIDPPVEKVSVNRQHFYERLGFVPHSFPHVHPPYRVGNSGHSLVIMACPAISQSEYDLFSAYVREVVMADSPNE